MEYNNNLSQQKCNSSITSCEDEVFNKAITSNTNINKLKKKINKKINNYKKSTNLKNLSFIENIKTFTPNTYSSKYSRELVKNYTENQDI